MTEFAEAIAKKNRVNLIAKSLVDNRQDWEPLWKDITNYLVPKRGRYDGDAANKPKTKGTTIVNATATKALQTLASGMHGGLTSPARPWFRLKMGTAATVESSDAKLWLKYVQDTMLKAFDSSNFYNAVHSLYMELAAFGTAALSQEEGEGDEPFIFRVFTAGTYSIGNGIDGKVNAIYREFWMTARNIVKKYDEENIKKSTLEAAKKIDESTSVEPEKFVKVCHLIYPRESFDKDMLDNKNMPFASLYWEKAGETEKFLEEKGYKDFPVHCPRWEVTDSDAYGQGPGLGALPDIKMLQQYSKGDIMSVHKSVSPPMAAFGSLKGRLDLGPGAQNTLNGNKDQAPQPLFDVKPGTLQWTGQRIQDLEQKISDWFFTSLFLTPDDRVEKTAYEVSVRQQEKMILLGPVLERLYGELLRPLIARSFNILWRKKFFPNPPQEILAMGFDPEFVSVLATAQKRHGLSGIETTTAFATQVAQTNKEVMDVLDLDTAIKNYAAIQEVPPNMVRDDQVINDLRQARAEMMAQQQQVEQQNTESGTVKNVAQAEQAMTQEEGGA